jgi:hypothetical protein
MARQAKTYSRLISGHNHITYSGRTVARSIKRVIRALRILKLLRFMPSLNIFWRAIVSARHQLILF